MYRVTGAQNTASIEQQLSDLAGQMDPELQLPVHPKNWWLGGELGLIEFITTWARSVADPVLVTYITGDQDPRVQLEAMAKRMFGFTAMLMSSEVLDIGKTRSFRIQANDECRKVVEMMYQPVASLALGTKVFFICVDHSTLWAIPWLYTNSRIVRDRSAFLTLVSEILKKIAPRPSKTSIPESVLRDFAAILHELFKNTDEWARTDALGRPWRRSVRGLAAEGHNWDEAALQSSAESSDALSTFFNSIRAKTKTDRLYFVEFTIFDTGIGLARRWLGSDWSMSTSLDEEYEACLNCLKKHHTSSNSPTKGLGLAEVMSTLGRLDALLKIRTGRLSLYRDFASYPHDQTNDDVSLLDFSSCSTVVTEMAPVFGTHFQILIPVV